jgi:type IV fimbrial biogenesis protein FimT
LDDHQRGAVLGFQARRFMLNRKRRMQGFTMLELVVAMTIMALLLAAAVPSYSGFVASTKVRNAAEAFYNAAQRARAEAVRRNVPVELVLTNDTPAAANIQSLTPSATGRNWVVRVPDATAADQLVDSKIGAESGGDVVTVNAGGTDRIRFNGVGETTSAAAVTVAFTHRTLNPSCNLTHPVRCVSVRISVGGQARLCEPNQPNTDARSC